MMGLSHCFLFILLIIISATQSAIIRDGMWLKLMHIAVMYTYICKKACAVVSKNLNVLYMVSYICVHFVL